MLSRRLVLRKETLAELASDDLRAVVAGAPSAGPSCIKTCHECVVLDVGPSVMCVPPTLGCQILTVHGC